jgi:tripartite-type tricarboxylate transporter receptor subunit TctC
MEENMTRTRYLGIALLVCACAAPALAQDKITPLSRDRTVTIVSGSGPGSSIDTMVRTFADIAARYTDQKFIVENRTGGSGIIATTYVLRQPADGYTLFGLTRSYTINFLTQPDMPNPLLQYHYVGLTMNSPMVIFTHKGSPYTDVKAMIADGKAKPGEQTWGATFVGSVEWLITNSIWQKLGYKGKYLAFKDGAGLNTAVMGKHVALGVGDMSDLLGKEELLTPLVVAAEQRDPKAPGVPTFREIGYDIVEGNFRGFVARQEVPQQAKDFYAQLYAKVMADPRWAAFLSDNVAQRPPAGGAQMERLCRESADKALPLMREAGLIKPAK